jgi:[NiFe] hydrogenase assembly HybE family chaperone
MTESTLKAHAAPHATSPAERPCPAATLEGVFRSIAQRQMQDVPIVNPALSVEAVGFRPWDEHWLGVLITPWFMNLWLMPRVSARWHPIAAGASRHYVFPAGVFEFIGGHDARLGDYQACSLFSPMFEFSHHAAAHDTAMAALDALFDAAHREAGDVPDASGASAATAVRPAAGAAPGSRPLSKRDFLFGLPARADREP